MRTAEIIPIRPYLIRRRAESDREAQASWERFEDRIEARAAEKWDTTDARKVWDMSQLTTWDEIALFFGLDGWA